MEIFQNNINSNQDNVLKWLIENNSIVEKSIALYQQPILDKAIAGNGALTEFCDMLQAIPVISESTEYNDRVEKFEELFTNNPGSSVAEILDILNGFVWADLEPTDDQKSRLNKKIRDNGVWTDKKLVNSLKRKFGRIKNS